MNNQNYIYVMFSSSPSIMGKTIQIFTKNKYNHVSISFEENLYKLYSFARYSYSSPFVGGFVEESSLRYCYKHNHDVVIKVCKIPVSNSKYKELKEYIESIKESRVEYIYNMISAMVAPIHKRVKANKSYTCVEFVTDTLVKFDIVSMSTKYCSIKKTEKALSEFVIYEGPILDFATFNDWGEDNFCNRKNVLIICLNSLRYFVKSIIRMFV